MTRKPSTQPDEDVSEDESYEVGYGKPPKNTRFKPGQSGNPKGRPRGAQNLRTVVRQTLQEKVTIREGNRARKIPVAEAIVRKCTNDALKGDPKALATLIQLARSTGLMDEEPDLSAAQSIGAEDQAIMEAFLERQGMDPSGLNSSTSETRAQEGDREANGADADVNTDQAEEPEGRT